MNFKTIRDRILYYLSVPKCVGCGTRLSINEGPLCNSCLKEYENVKERNCSVCAKRLENCTCSNKYLEAHYVRKLVKVYRYVHRDDLPSNRLIYSLKRDNRKDVLDFLSDELAAALSNSVNNIDKCVFVNVPRRRETALKYGIDHAQLLAKSLAKRFSATYYQPIISKTKKAQKKTVGSERIKNAEFKLKKSAKSLSGKTVIIVDDIVTTGASMGACASLIRALGTKKILGAAVSVAYKDKYIPLDQNDRFYSMI